MLERLRIRNYRGFTDLGIDRLSRINLFTGRNNSGKTTLLEALFLLCGAGNAQMALYANVMREFNLASGPAMPETFWKTIFTDFDVEKTVEIEGRHSAFGSMILSIATDRSSTIKIPLDGSSRTSMPELSNSMGLLFSFKMDSGETTESRIYMAGGGIQVESADVQFPFQTMFLSSRMGSPKEDAMRLGQLRKRKQGDFVVEALRIVEPKLQSVEDNSASGTPMIWGDIGLPELVPLPVMGEGMTRIARLVLAISAAPNGIVLVDEIENGLHHSTLHKVWEVVDRAAERFNTQIIAATHSFECMAAAHHALDDASLRVHRLEVIDEKTRCVSYEPKELEAAFSHSLEVR